MEHSLKNLVQIIEGTSDNLRNFTSALSAQCLAFLARTYLQPGGLGLCGVY